VVRLGLLLPFESSHFLDCNFCTTLRRLLFRKGYIYGAVNGHRKAILTAAVQSLNGAKPNTNPTRPSNTDPNTNPIS